MKRSLILPSAVMAFVLAACGGEPTASSPAESVAAVTPEPTAAPSSAAPSEAAPTPAESASGDASTDSELADMLPDELNGVARTDVPGLDQMIAPALEAQGIDATDVDFVFASYGEGTDGLIVQAIRIPGLGQAQLEMLAQMMAGQSTEVDVEQTEVGGKSVLEMTGADVPGAAYMYFADGAMFTIVGESADLAAQLLSELP